MVPSHPPGLVSLGSEGRGDPATSEALTPQVQDANKDRVFNGVRLQMDAILPELETERDATACLLALGLLDGQSGLGSGRDHPPLHPGCGVHDRPGHFTKRIVAADPLDEGNAGTDGSKLALQEFRNVNIPGDSVGLVGDKKPRPVIPHCPEGFQETGALLQFCPTGDPQVFAPSNHGDTLALCPCGDG